MLLERRMKYDRLGINDALLQFEIELNRNCFQNLSALCPPWTNRRRRPLRRHRRRERATSPNASPSEVNTMTFRFGYKLAFLAASLSLKLPLLMANFRGLWSAKKSQIRKELS